MVTVWSRPFRNLFSFFKRISNGNHTKWIITRLFYFREDVNYKEIESESINIDDNNLTSNEIVLNNIKKDYKQFLFQKDLDYQDENEFRIVLIKRNLEKSSQKHFIDISNSLKLIILGDKFPKVYLPTVKDLSSKLNIKYKKLHWEHNQYFLL